MRARIRKILPIVALAFAMVSPARAIDAELAKLCRALMVKAIPTETYGPSGSAVA